MINAQEAKYIQKTEDGLSGIFGIIEEDVRYAAKHGNSQVEIDFCYADDFEKRLDDIVNILKNLEFEASSPSYGFLRVEW